MHEHRFNRVVLAVFAVAPWMSFAGCSHSSGEQPPAASAPTTTSTSVMHEDYRAAAPQDIRVVAVTVQEVDRENHEVTFKAQVTPEANIQRNGQVIKIDQLEKGDSLRMFVDTSTGKVVRIDVVDQQRPQGEE